MMNNWYHFDCVTLVLKKVTLNLVIFKMLIEFQKLERKLKLILNVIKIIPQCTGSDKENF